MLLILFQSSYCSLCILSHFKKRMRMNERTNERMNKLKTDNFLHQHRVLRSIAVGKRDKHNLKITESDDFRIYQ